MFGTRGEGARELGARVGTATVDDRRGCGGADVSDEVGERVAR